MASPRLAPVHRKYPQEMAIVGRLLVGYSELEIDLMNCVAVARDDLDAVLKSMFRARGETQRIDVADALGRQVYAKYGLETEFSMAIGAVRYCLRIRNQFAHCYWHDPGAGLCFVSLEELADQNTVVRDLLSLTFYFIDLPLLQKQEAFFQYAEDCLSHVNFEGRVRSKKLAKNPFAKPSQLTPPPLHLADI